MFLNLAVVDKRNQNRGSVRLELDFQAQAWSIPAAQQQAWAGVGFSNPPKGSFELKDWGVMWLWDQRPGEHNTLIIWKPPVAEDDSSHPKGQARIYDPKDASFKDAVIDWSVEAAPKPTLSPVRQRVKDIIRGIPFNYFPPAKENFPNPPPNAKTYPKPDYAKETKVTNCGEFPGWIAKHMGGANLPADTFMKFHDKWGDYALTAPMIGWDAWAKKLENARKAPGSIWVPYSKGLKPQPGDIYILLKADKVNFAHVGIIFECDRNPWTTADCGQGDGFGGCYQRRTFDEATGSLTLLLPGPPPKYKLPDAGLRYLKGWVNIDNLFAGWRPK